MGSVAVLLSFGDAIAKSKRSPEKLFVLLDMYEIMRELHSEACAITLKILHFPLFSDCVNFIFFLLKFLRKKITGNLFKCRCA